MTARTKASIAATVQVVKAKAKAKQSEAKQSRRPNPQREREMVWAARRENPKGLKRYCHAHFSPIRCSGRRCIGLAIRKGLIIDKARLESPLR